MNLPAQEEEVLLSRLKDILLEEDRLERSGLEQRVEDIIALLNDKDLLREKVKPLLEENNESLKAGFSKEFGAGITEALKLQIESSQEEVIHALYPIIGKLIKKYIQAEIGKIIDQVDLKVNATFSFANLKRRIQGLFTGVKEESLALKEVVKPQFEEILVIQKDTGLLIGSYSKNQTVDRDMIAGMMTAIKAFAEDAFAKKELELDSIQYDDFTILIQSFYTYYVAVVISGFLNHDYKDELQNRILDFAGDRLKKPVKEINDTVQEEISRNLKSYFDEL